MEMKHVFIIDLVKHKGDTLSLINSLIAHVRSTYSVHEIRWYVREDQTRLLEGSAIKRTSRYESEDYVAGVLRWITELSQNGASGAIFHVLSYDGILLSTAATLNGPSVVVSTMHISNVYQGGSRFAATRLTLFQSLPQVYRSDFAQDDPSYDRSGPFTLQKAIQLAKSVLRRGGHVSQSTALHQPSLRPLMTRIDPRAGKNLSDPTSSRLITLIVESGLTNGWLGQVRRGCQTGREYVWLIEEAQSNSTATTQTYASPQFNDSRPVVLDVEKAGDTGVSVLLSTSEAAIVSDATQSSEANGNGESVVVPSGSLEQAEGGISTTANESIQPNPSEEEAVGEKEIVKVHGTNGGSDRPWRIMEAQLRERGIGSPPVPRAFLFDAIESIFSEKPENDSLKVGLMISRAQQLAIDSARQQGYVRSQNWPAITKCFLRMLLESEVLLRPDGTPILNEIGGRSAEVASIRSDFRDCCEAVLLECIIKGVGGVRFSDRDFHSLGLALFQRGAANGVDEFNDRIDYLMKVLAFNGRIEKDIEGWISVKPNLNGVRRWVN